MLSASLSLMFSTAPRFLILTKDWTGHSRITKRRWYSLHCTSATSLVEHPRRTLCPKHIARQPTFSMTPTRVCRLEPANEQEPSWLIYIPVCVAAACMYSLHASESANQQELQ